MEALVLGPQNEYFFPDVSRIWNSIGIFEITELTMSPPQRDPESGLDRVEDLLIFIVI